MSRTSRFRAGLCLLVTTAAAYHAHADVPRAISYQGRLEGVGSPVNLTVRLYSVAVGGAPLFTENHPAVPLEDGVFSIFIGANTGGGVPDSALNTLTLFLGLSVNGGAELTPRTRIGMVPFSAKARWSEGFVVPDSFTVAASVNSSGNINLPASGGAGGKLIFGSGATPMITAGHNNAAANAKRMWISHSENFPTWGIQYRDIASDGFPADTLELVSGSQTQPRFAFELFEGNFRIFQSDSGEKSFELLAEGGTSTGSRFIMYDDGGAETVNIDGDWFGAGFLKVNDATNTEAVRLDGLAGEIWVFDVGDSSTVNIDAGFSQAGAAIEMASETGTETVEIKSAEVAGQGAQILLRKADGTTTIEIDADFNGDGRIITQELQITGGSDLSEQFDITAPDGTLKAGMVVCIDPRRPGELRVSASAYDRTVAGILSGAGDVKPGLWMGQKDTKADGQHPVALTGRVYCWADASAGPIQPGDLLTTSDVAGHAMKVADHTRAQGAVIGKAMTSLESGRGLVLVLVSLQ